MERKSGVEVDRGPAPPQRTAQHLGERGQGQLMGVSGRWLAG